MYSLEVPLFFFVDFLATPPPPPPIFSFDVPPGPDILVGNYFQAKLQAKAFSMNGTFMTLTCVLSRDECKDNVAL